MNDLARLVHFSFGLAQNYRIIDRNGDPWFVLKDFCKILGIKNPSDAVKDFPPEYVSSVVCDIDLSYITSAKPRARKTQRVLIISEAGLLRLITRSDKPIARQIQAKIFEEVLPAYRKHGINWASLPKVWKYRGQMLNYAEFRAKKEEAYFKRFPDASPEDFIRTLPPLPAGLPAAGTRLRRGCGDGSRGKSGSIRVIGREGDVALGIEKAIFCI
jgi:prophage antirepressor-like protein